MDDSSRTIIFAAICVFLLIGFVGATAFLLSTKWKRASESSKFVMWNRFHRFYWDFPMLKTGYRLAYQHVGNLAVYNQRELRIVTAKYYTSSIAMSFGVFVGIYLFYRDILSAICGIAVCAVLTDTLVNKQISKVDQQIYSAMATMLSAVSERYTITLSISESLQTAKIPTILKRQVDQIVEILTSTDGIRKLSKFYDECPNRVMRTFATTCYIRNDVGDEKSEGSPFKTALGLIRDEVDQKRVQLFDQQKMFGNLQVIPLAALPLYPVIAIAYRNLVPATVSVQDGYLGYIARLVIIIVATVCFSIISSINNPSFASVDDTVPWIRALLRHTRIRNLAIRLKPSSFRKQHKLEDDMLGCLSSKDIIYISLERHIYAALSLVICIFATVIILIMTRNAVYNNMSTGSLMTTKALTQEEVTKLRAYDAEILARDLPPEEQELRDHLTRMLDGWVATDVDSQVTRIIKKYRDYHNLVFHWWFAFIYLALVKVAYQVPVWLLALRVRLVNEEAIIDVLQLQTIIAILMDSTLDTYSVIYWMMKSSDIHKPVLTKCYMDYPCDPLKAVKTLRLDSTIPEMINICDKLESTVFNISLREAFEDLVRDRSTVLKLRDIKVKDALQRKRRLCSPIALAPAYTVMALGFLMPIIIVALDSFSSVMEQVKTLQSN